MSSWTEILRYLAKYNDEIVQATRPLRDCFGVKYFTYHRIDQDGNYTVLLDRPDWAEHYVAEKFYLNDPLMALWVAKLIAFPSVLILVFVMVGEALVCAGIEIVP